MRPPALRLPLAALAAWVVSLASPLTTSLAAQEAATGRIEGQVSDSVHHRPATGAIVLLSRVAPEPRQFLSTIADAAGRFHFDSLGAGRYTINFSDATLDSLELLLPDREVVLAANARARVDLGSPSSASLRAAACPGVQLTPAQGAIVGGVRDATTERPIPGATVVVAWNELTVDRTTLRASNQERRGSVRADSVGGYRLCGLPLGETVVVQAQDSSWSSGAVQAMVDSVSSVRVLSLSIDRSATAAVASAAPDAAAADTVTRSAPAAALQRGTASVHGVVYGVGGTPSADVQVRVFGAAGSARTDAQGRFELSDQPAGTQMLEARRVGYVMTRVPVELRGGQVVEQDVHMTRIVSLDSIRIVAQRSRYPDFERHRKNAFGRYFDETDILQRHPYSTADLFRTIPGFRVAQGTFGDVLVSSRGPTSLRARTCQTNVVIDGMQHMDIDMVHPSDIAAVEAYPSSVGVPPEYSFGSPCGAVVIWTKR